LGFESLSGSLGAQLKIGYWLLAITLAGAVAACGEKSRTTQEPPRDGHTVACDGTSALHSERLPSAKAKLAGGGIPFELHIKGKQLHIYACVSKARWDYYACAQRSFGGTLTFTILESSDRVAVGLSTRLGAEPSVVDRKCPSLGCALFVSDKPEGQRCKPSVVRAKKYGQITLREPLGERRVEVLG
jgi:hypothetical protein